jgi:plasmid stability protein
VAQIVIRNLEESVKRRLRQRAKRHGRSMEEEARVILREAVSDAALKEGLGTRLAKHFAGKVPKEFKVMEMRGAKFRIPPFDD